MKDALVGALVVLALAVVFAPWALMLLDGACWFYANRICTSIEWNSTRVLIGLAWPLGVWIVVGGTLSMTNF